MAIIGIKTSPYFTFLKNITPDFPITHTHHIIPKSQGGTDDENNLVRLSPAQHFYAHWLWDQEHNTHTSQVFICRSGLNPTCYEDCLSYNEMEQERIDVSEETRKKMSKAHKGRVFSEESKKKMSEAHKGHIVSEEQKKKISKSNLNNPKKSKPVQQFTLDGQFIAEYPSIAEAARQVGVRRTSIMRCCQGKCKTIVNSLWRLKNN